MDNCPPTDETHPVVDLTAVDCGASESAESSTSTGVDDAHGGSSLAPSSSQVDGSSEMPRKRKAVRYSADGSAGGYSSLSEDELRKLISPLSREQILGLLSAYCLIHPDLYAATIQMAQASPASRRLMIRNISFNTSDEAFRAVFDALGEVEDCTVVRDRGTGKSKGFGFVTFKELDAVGQALRSTLEVDGREWAVKLASDPSGQEISGQRTGVAGVGGRCKLFVRNLSDDTVDSRLLSEFSGYGPIQEAVVVRESTTGKSKGYGFVTFSSSDDAAKALQQPQRVIDGRMAFVTQATPSSHSRAGSQPGSSLAAAAAAANSMMPMSRQPGPPPMPMQMAGLGVQQQMALQQQQLAQNYAAAQMHVMQSQAGPPLPPGLHGRQTMPQQHMQQQQQYAYMAATSPTRMVPGMVAGMKPSAQ
eukprot:GHVS01054440.1.p1 GENE.GHVS01054440.1~~GHVS01054440.1.p1  ORF type:complete len:419 (-),score=71.58 GHVS01054440.1:225-1481(-)